MIGRLKITFVSAIVLLLVPFSAFPQGTPELLLPVEQTAIDRLMSPSQYGLRAQLYYAKRFRIVNVNFDVLDREDQEFTVTPFKDLQMVVVATPDKYVSAYDQLKQWRGELKDSKLQFIDPQTMMPTGETMRVPVDLMIRTGDHEIPLKLVREIAEARGDTATLGVLPDAGTLRGASDLSAGFGKMYLRTLYGQWHVPALQTSIVIRPVDGDPRFHIVYVEDSEKKVAPGDDVPDEATRRKFEARRKFMRELEQERKNAILQEKQN